MTSLRLRAPAGRRAWSAIGSVTAVSAGVLGGSLAHAGHAMLLLPLLALAAVAGLLYLAATRMRLFVLTLLLIRPTLDVTNATVGAQAGSGIAATVVSFLLLVAVVVWFAAQRRAGALEPVSQLSISGLVLLAAGVISTAASLRPTASAAEAARLAAAVAMLLILVALVRRHRDIRGVLGACYCSMVVPLAFAAVQLVVGVPGDRIAATFRHPNAFGAYLAVLLVAGVALLFALRGRDRWLLAGILAAGCVALLFTYSRGSWIATAAGVVVVAVVQRRVGLIAMLVAGALVASTAPSVQARWSDLTQERTLRGTGGNSLVWRVDYWRTTLKLVEGNPGTGIGLKQANFETVEGNHIHNDFVRMYVEAGVVGLLSLLWFLMVLAATAVRALRRSENDQQFAVAAGFTGSLVAVSIMMVGGNIITTVVVLWYFFALAACAHWIARAPERSPPDDGMHPRMLVAASDRR